MKSTAALWYVWTSPAHATSNAAPGHHTPAWVSRYIRWKYRLTNRRLSLMPSSARPNRVEVPRRRIEHIRYDEQQEPDDVDPAVPVHEQMARDQPDQERPQGDVVG